MTAIYGLHSGDGEIRYVGKSVDPQRRLHVHTSSHNHYRGIPVYDWIFSLAQQGIKPQMVVLEEVDNSEWEVAEQKWIKQFRENGARLLNVLDGGDTGPTFRGSQNGHSTLTEEDVAEIKLRLCDGVEIVELSKDYCVGTTTIFNIKCGRTWVHVPWPKELRSYRPRPPKLTSEVAASIKAMLRKDAPRKEVAKAHNVSLNIVHKIALGLAWRNV